MNNIATVDLFPMETSLSSRSKKLPPPPLCLPATTTITDEDKLSNSSQQRERKKSANNCCLPSSSDDCPHKSVTYILPVSRRTEILKTLVSSSSTLLAPPLSEAKSRKSSNATYANQINLLKQRQPISKSTVDDAEWIDFMRLIIHKPLEDDLKSLLDKYKTAYFDQVNAPNASDDTIRSSLCTIVTEALTTYSSSSIQSASSSTSTTTDDLTTNVSSPISTTATTTSLNNGSAKRKRKSIGPTSSLSLPIPINSQTKFVISHIIPGKYDNCNGNKTNNQQHKQFQKKYSHLFKYIPDKDEHTYLLREDHLKSTFFSSSGSPINQNICLMLYDEVYNNMDDYDLELSGISMDDSFTLPESLLVHINSIYQ
ncbi:hypothetical protein I4U23_021522 [Adineta vaga]|nr:hypothetical protein I4U23_021522 [Adineta vaga]